MYCDCDDADCLYPPLHSSVKEDAIECMKHIMNQRTRVLYTVFHGNEESEGYMFSGTVLSAITGNINSVISYEKWRDITEVAGTLYHGDSPVPYYFLFTDITAIHPIVESYGVDSSEFLCQFTLYYSLEKLVQDHGFDLLKLSNEARHKLERGGLKEELMARVWHPRNAHKFKHLGDDTFEEL